MAITVMVTMEIMVCAHRAGGLTLPTTHLRNDGSSPPSMQRKPSNTPRSNSLVGDGLAAKFSVHSRGAGGIVELGESLPTDDSCVLFGLVTCIIGSGTFARTKYVMINLSGAACPPIRRMKWNEFKPEAHQVLGLDCVEFAAEARSDVTLEALIELLLRVCVSDDLGEAEISAASIRADLEEQARRAQAALRERQASVGAYTGPRTLLAMGKRLSVPEVVKLVHQPAGPLNWLLINANMELIEAGGGSVREMADHLDPSQVAFGMLRMGFGSGQFKRNYWLFIHWSGDVAAVTARGKANASLEKCKAALSPTQIDFFGATKEEVTVDVFIKKVVKYCCVDGETGKGESALSFEAFMEALQEDQKKLEEEFGLGSAGGGGQPVGSDFASLDVREAVRSVRDTKDPFNWVVIQPVANAKVGTATQAAAAPALKKAVDTTSAFADKQSPFGEFKLKKCPHPAVMKDVVSPGPLKAVETDDRSAPVIDPEVKVGKNGRADLMAAINKLP